MGTPIVASRPGAVAVLDYISSSAAFLPTYPCVACRLSASPHSLADAAQPSCPTAADSPQSMQRFPQTAISAAVAPVAVTAGFRFPNPTQYPGPFVFPGSRGGQIPGSLWSGAGCRQCPSVLLEPAGEVEECFMAGLMGSWWDKREPPYSISLGIDGFKILTRS
jgi:hypothetical protein